MYTSANRRAYLRCTTCSLHLLQPGSLEISDIRNRVRTLCKLSAECYPLEVGPSSLGSILWTGAHTIFETDF